jgi:hypothetical protein
MSGMGKRYGANHIIYKTARNSQLPRRIQYKPTWTNSVMYWMITSLYNWLVASSAATTSNCWKLLTASVSTDVWKHSTGTQVNCLGRNNTEDWTISSQTPTTVLTGHGEGSETRRSWRIEDRQSSMISLRYSPVLLRKHRDTRGFGVLELSGLNHLSYVRQITKKIYVQNHIQFKTISLNHCLTT